MEKKNNKGIIIALCIVIVVLIGAITYMFVSGTVSFDAKEENKTTNNEQKEEEKTETKDEEIKQEDTKEIKIISGEYGDSATTIILHDEEVYINMMTCAPGNDRFAFICDYVDNIVNSYEKYEFDNLEYDSLFEYPLEGSKFVGLKLNTKDVKDIYSIEQGQGLSPSSQGIALIKKDGTLEFVSYKNIFDKKLTSSKVDNLQNIIKVENVTESDGVYTYAIDSNGNKHNLIDYFR